MPGYTRYIGLSTILQLFMLISVLFLSTGIFPYHAFANEAITTEKDRGRLIEEHDVLDISVFEENDLSLSVIVAGDGTIAYPLIGKVAVIGLTTYEIGEKLEKLLFDGEFLINPMVFVTLDIELMQRYHEKEVFVIGEVENPGPVTMLRKQLTVLEAVSMAGGLTGTAASGKTYVIRIEDGKEKKINVNLNKVRKGARSLDIKLKAGDVVFVPEGIF